MYFQGGGWTSGDKSALTKYCANQAAGGMVVVNVNYRKPPRSPMGMCLKTPMPPWCGCAATSSRAAS
ncbi:alpha/beta hydrolase fold domain-containing protein [Pseudarthrobacter sp. NamE5]|uniref:alpha/beta hydrolase fold domain-containing protein n=1 Tax=Pseudarthrobacter sp. NamE5 TaxID=2576839 RepID=UPI001F103984|nr:alpha/beta hydrolase fold domain-containing protein [Pseudarthrobacter sp. NamE5]